jgi:hypothetical protein
MRSRYYSIMNDTPENVAERFEGDSEYRFHLLLFMHEREWFALLS